MFRAVIWKDLARTGTKGAKMPKPKASSGKLRGPSGASGGENFGGSDCNPRYHEDDEVNSEEGRLKKKTPNVGGVKEDTCMQCMRLSEKEKADQDTRHTKYLCLIVIEYDSILTVSSISSHTLKCVKSNMFRANLPLCTSSLCWFNPARVRISQVTQISSASIFASFALFHPLNVQK